MVDIKATTRKTRQGYYQPVLIVDNKVKHTPADMAEPSLDRRTAQKYANAWRNESIQCGYITHIG